jgi:hypothetical protein
VVVPPLLHALVEVHQQLAHRGRVGVVVVDLLEQPLHRVRGRQRRQDITVPHLCGHLVSLPGQVTGERVEQAAPRHGRRDAVPLGAVLGVRREHRLITPAEHGLDLAELCRLEPAGAAEPVAEPEELGGRHGLEHVELGHHDLQDGQRPPQRAHDVGGAARLELALELAELVQQLLEPQLVDLVDDDEQHLVVLAGTGLLGGEQLIEPQVAGVGDAFGHDRPAQMSRVVLTAVHTSANRVVSGDMPNLNRSGVR